MFELMNNQQLDPNDLQSGYQSLSLYNEAELQHRQGVDFEHNTGAAADLIN